MSSATMESLQLAQMLADLSSLNEAVSTVAIKERLPPGFGRN